MTVDDSPFKIDAAAAEEALQKSPEASEPQPVDPIGEKQKLRKFLTRLLPLQRTERKFPFFSHPLRPYESVYFVCFQWINGTTYISSEKESGEKRPILPGRANKRTQPRAMVVFRFFGFSLRTPTIGSYFLTEVIFRTDITSQHRHSVNNFMFYLLQLSAALVAFTFFPLIHILLVLQKVVKRQGGDSIKARLLISLT